MTSETITVPSLLSLREGRATVIALVGLWAVFSAVFAISSWSDLTQWRQVQNDDLLRLVEVRDWLAGQSWSDLTQYRIGPEAGLSMHWSRLGDIGPALITVVAEPYVGRDLAEHLALALYPPLLMLGFLLLSVDCARRLGGPAALLPGVFVAITAMPLLAHFMPGRIDHHGLQIVLMLVMLRAVVGPPDSGSWAMAGTAMAVSLVIGFETAPYIGIVCAVLFLLWLRCGDEVSATLKGFGLASSAAMALLLASFRPQDWSSAYCDAFSPGVASAVMMAGGICVGLALASSRLPDARSRAVTLLALCGFCGAVLAFFFPACLAGPFGAIDPFLKDIWLNHVNEALPLGAVILSDPDRALVLTGLPAASLVAGAWVLRRADLRRPAWLGALAMLLMAVLVMMTQVRASAFATAFALPVIAAGIAWMRTHADTPKVVAVAMWLAGCGATYLFAAAGLGQAMKAPAAAASAASAQCRAGDAYSQLAELPPGRILGTMDLGPFVLAFTPHKVVGAPYHRNNAGNRDNFLFFLGASEEGRLIATRRAIDYVMICPSSPESALVAGRAGNGLLSNLLSGAVPSWLEPISSGPGSAIRLYRVKR